jgi:hypothetical protein
MLSIIFYLINILIEECDSLISLIIFKQLVLLDDILINDVY